MERVVAEAEPERVVSAVESPEDDGPVDDGTGVWCPPACRRQLAFEDDLDGFLPLLKEDAKALVNWQNAAVLGTALGGSLIVRSELDDEIRERAARHPERWGSGSRTLGRLGGVYVQVPVLLLFHGYALHQQDEHLHDFSGSLVSAFTLTGLSTLVIKGIANTERPSDDWNGGKFGFPSYHTASTMSAAAVADEYYGWRASLPLYALSGLIGWSRIDERDHDLSDVIFGAALGYVIGKSVAKRHRGDYPAVRLLPFAHPNDSAAGLLLDWEF